jgi:hypothetical protein
MRAATRLRTSAHAVRVRSACCTDSGGARATNVEPARRVRARQAHTPSRRQHSARRGKCRLRALRICRQERACGRTRLKARGLRLDGTLVRGGARRGAPSCGAPFALKLREATCLGPGSSASAPVWPWKRQRRTFHVERPRTSFYGAAVLTPAAPSAAAAQRATPTSPVSVRSAQQQLRGGRVCATVRAATQTPSGLRRFARPSRAQFAPRLRRQSRVTQHSKGHARNPGWTQRWSVQGGKKELYGRITCLCHVTRRALPRF